MQCWGPPLLLLPEVSGCLGSDALAQLSPVRPQLGLLLLLTADLPSLCRATWRRSLPLLCCHGWPSSSSSSSSSSWDFRFCSVMMVELLQITCSCFFLSLILVLCQHPPFLSVCCLIGFTWCVLSSGIWSLPSAQTVQRPRHWPHFKPQI